MVGDLAERVSELLGRQVHVAFVDVLGPTPSEVLVHNLRRPVTWFRRSSPAATTSTSTCRRTSRPADIPRHRHGCAGPVPEHGSGGGRRLVECGWRPGDSVVLAAAGTSDTHAQSDLRRTAALMSAVIGDRVESLIAATGEPRVADAVSKLRRRGARGVSSSRHTCWRTGLFQDRLRGSGADLVAEPLGSASGDGAADRQPVPAGPGTDRRVALPRHTCVPPPRSNRCGASILSPTAQRLGPRQDRIDP